MPYILGLTGNIASGKSTVGLMLLELGAYTYVDADNVVHELYLPGRPLVGELVQAFGNGILTPDGGVDRRILGQVVFGDIEKLRLLESIVHPHVRTALIDILRSLPMDAIGILDAIKLVESGYAPLCHAVWLVVARPEIQLRRMIETRDMTEQEAQARLAAQPPLEEKRRAATEIIDNSGSMDDLRRQVTEAWNRFTASIHA